MTRDELTAMYEGKKEMVEHYAAAIKADHAYVADIVYDYEWLREDKDWVEEYVTVIYLNGTKAMRSANGDNSFGLIKEILRLFEEI